MRIDRCAILPFTVIILCAVVAWAQQASRKADSFRLNDGDTVVFFGDSITEQKLYTSDIENFVLTRFPKHRIQFVHSGVGGDKVSGGWAGPIDLRLSRDVIGYHPAMVTIMLGMNDGYYRPFDKGIETTYEEGYRHIIDRLQTELPQARFTLLRPSPYDDVTRAPEWEGGYNATMVRFGEFVSRLAEEKHTFSADLNLPVVTALTTAKAADLPLASTLIRDRVHPGTGVHWLLAEAILRTWNAPSIVTSVRIDAAHGKVADVANTKVAKLERTDNTLTWTQQDDALPLPFPAPASDPFLALILRVSDLTGALDQEMLKVDELPGGEYELHIDDQLVGAFTSAELGRGVNLATLDTPMLRQSRQVAMETQEKNEIESIRFTLNNGMRKPDISETLMRLDRAIADAIAQQRNDVQPLPHRYVIVRSVHVADK